MDMMKSLNSYYNKIDKFFEFCKTYPEVAIEKCGQALEENKECFPDELEKSGENACKIMNSSKCKKIYDNIHKNSIFVCKEATKYHSFELLDNFRWDYYFKYLEKCTEDYINYEKICGYRIQTIYNCLVDENFEEKIKDDSIDIEEKCNNIQSDYCFNVYNSENGLLDTLNSCYLYYTNSGYNKLLDFGFNISYDSEKNKETYKILMNFVKII